jgi:predicted DNA-binding protein with PD1-like motif
MLQLHPMRLKPGQDLKECLTQYVHLQQLQAAFIITCVGSLTRYHLRFADRSSGSHGEGHFEIVSLTGTLSTAGMHLHMSISDGEGRTIGGHLLEGNLVYTTAEIVLGESTEHRFKRENDGTTAWDELQIAPRNATEF